MTVKIENTLNALGETSDELCVVRGFGEYQFFISGFDVSLDCADVVIINPGKYITVMCVLMLEGKKIIRPFVKEPMHAYTFSKAARKGYTVDSLIKRFEWDLNNGFTYRIRKASKDYNNARRIDI